MTFVYPWVLLFLAVPVLLFWTVLARPPGLVVPFDGRAHPRRRVWRVVLGVVEMAPLIVLAIAVVVAAEPQVLKPSRQERELTNVQICMDVSGSMMGSRYENASTAIQEFTRMREGDAFGLILFGVEQMRWMPLTKDLDAVRNAMPFANPARQPPQMGGTYIGAALRYAKKVMEAEADEGDRLIVLVSDGESFDLGDGQEYDVANELKDGNITLYHIHMGESDPPLEVSELARETGGESLVGTDRNSLKAVFQHIDRMKPARFRPQTSQPLDHFAPFAMTALVLLGVHLLGLLGLRYTPW